MVILLLGTSRNFPMEYPNLEYSQSSCRDSIYQRSLWDSQDCIWNSCCLDNNKNIWLRIITTWQLPVNIEAWNLLKVLLLDLECWCVTTAGLVFAHGRGKSLLSSTSRLSYESCGSFDGQNSRFVASYKSLFCRLAFYAISSYVPQRFDNDRKEF